MVLPVIFSSYLVAVGVYLALQVRYAEHTRRQLAATSAVQPSVDVIIPCFNEDPATLANCLAAIAAQDYGGKLFVHVVDDGSANVSTVDPVYADYERRFGFRIIKLPANRGKRFAQAEVITSSEAEIVVAVDSDTVLEPDGIRRIVAAMDDLTVGAAMGEILASNATTNWLTRVLNQRYWYACNAERAAQSRFGAVLCCSGPFAAYRRSVLEKVLDDYLNQTFLGRPTTHGEDRHLTNLVLRTGSQAIYVPSARARTIAPDRLRPFLRQQLRWNRAIYRDTIGILGQLPGLGRYLLLDAFIQLAGPRTTTTQAR